jgi:site-specific DNA recombinase
VKKPSTHTTAREYLRVSLDRSGRARSVDEQHTDNERAAADRGVRLSKQYADNNVSASRYATKTRDDFALLLGDLRVGRFGADELWLWESSRGSRRVGEWVELIEACETAGVGIWVTTHGRLYDPANGRDRRTLLEDAVDSEYESSKVSLRAKRAAAANAAAGLPNGPTAYGYRRIYDEHTKKLVRQEPHPDEAPVVRELFDRIRKGHSLRSIAADYEARGIRTRAKTKQNDDGEVEVVTPGKPFSAQHLRTLALTPTYVGLRVHTPQVNGTRDKYKIDGAVKAVWQPLVTEETFYAVRDILTRPERKTTRSGRAVHLLSMIARCAVCDAPLAVTRRADGTRNGKPRPAGETYQCHRKGCVRINKAELDALAEEAILGYVADVRNYQPLSTAEHGDAELQRVRGELAAARTELKELRDSVVAGTLSVANLTAVGPGLEARVDALEAQEKQLSTPSEMRDTIEPSKNVQTQWKAMPIEAKRRLARTVLSPDRLGVLRVARRPRDAGPRHVPAVDRVDFEVA